MATLITVATYYSPSEAFIAKSLLEQHGFTVFLHDSYYSQADWGRIVALGGLRLAVPETESEDAAHLLSITAPIPSEESDPIDLCPNCGADNVFRYTHWLSLLVTIFAGVIFVVRSKRRQCRECEHRWRI